MFCNLSFENPLKSKILCYNYRESEIISNEKEAK